MVIVNDGKDSFNELLLKENIELNEERDKPENSNPVNQI